MFDLRYHVASLAAVFLMLVVGILIGVGISGRGFVDDAERNRFNARIAGLEEQADAAEATADDFERRQKAAKDFVESAYPVLVEGRLAGKNVAVAVLGSVEQGSFRFVERAIGDADGRVDADASGDASPPARCHRGRAGGPARARRLRGRRASRESRPGPRPRARDRTARRRSGTHSPVEIVEEQSGGLSGPVDGVVVIRPAEPQEGGSARFLAGFYQGLGSTGEPVVGVEPARVEQSAIPVFQRYGLSTVDGIESELGQLALVLLLSNADPGHYGVRDSATNGILPPIEPLPAPGG